MNHFGYRGGWLFAEDVPLAHIAAEVGTPFYCYSTATMTRHFTVFRDAFGIDDALICYAVKANSNLAVLRVLANCGAGADVVSEGEMLRALSAGIPASKIVFSGVGKTRGEMAAALGAQIFQFNVESVEELKTLSEVATSLKVVAPVALRINPDVDAGTHKNISTGKATNKFGIAWDWTERTFELGASLPGIEIKGIDVHIGSQITDLTPFEEAFSKVADLVRSLRKAGHIIERLDLGGGLGIPYSQDEKAPPLPDAYAKLIRRLTDGLGVRLVFEPGRMIVGNAGVLVTQVITVKKTDTKSFAVVDAAMNDLMRPALYDAWHEILPLKEADPSVPRAPMDVVGPVCESTDVFAENRPLPPLTEGDAVVFLSAGAYGAVQASEYNSRPLVPEVLVHEDKFAVIRARPTYQEMMDRESVPTWLGPNLSIAGGTDADDEKSGGAV